MSLRSARLSSFVPLLSGALLLSGAGCGESARSPTGSGGLGGATSTGGAATGGGSTSGGSASAGGSGSSSSGGAATGGGSNTELVSCDPSEIVCQPIVPPEPCPEGRVHSVDDGCHGACVPIESCDCTGGRACPDENQYVCWLSAGHCGPYVR